MFALRIASWIVVVCALVAAFGIFMPAFEVPIAGHVVSKRESISLRKAAGDRMLVRRLLAAYHGSASARAGGRAITKVRPHLGGRAEEYVGDAGDAMDTLSGISDEDAKTYTTLFAIVVWAFFGLGIATAVAVFVDLVSGRYRRWHLVAAVVLATVVAAIGAAMMWGCKLAVFEANDEVGSTVLALGSAPYIIVIAATGALGGAIATLVLHIRGRRDGTVAVGGQRAG